MKSWLISQAQSAEIKMSTVTSTVSCNISKILSKVRYTRVDIGVCRKLFSLDLFCAPSLMSRDIPLQLSYLGKVLFACILTHIQGFVSVSVLQSFTVCNQEPLKGSLADLGCVSP